MEAYIFEWLNLLGRWFHVIVGIAWIGASFYFIWLDNHLQEPVSSDDIERGVGGEIWSVHGGGFYHAQKYQISPPELPEKLHWFKWEAYSTWLSGMFLMCLMYWYSAEIYLIDPNVAAISKPLAVLIGIACIVVGWFAYDYLCRSRYGQNERTVALILFVVLCFVAFGLCQIFSGRGAYMHFGAMLGTIMVANVFFIIIPGQKDLVAAKQQGRQPDPVHGIRGKQRSVHNTYFTLPVLFVMISNHYAMTYAHAYNWLILIAISLAGALIRVYFVARHRGKASMWPLLLAVIILGVVAAALVPKPATSQAITDNTNDDQSANASAHISSVSFADVTAVVQQRCANCHAVKPSYPGFASAPMGIRLDNDEQIRANAASIYQQSVVTKAMPIGNLTGMTNEERALIGQWVAQGGLSE